MVFSRFRGEDIKPELFSVGLTKLHYDALHPATLKRFALFIRSLGYAFASSLTEQTFLRNVGVLRRPR